MENDTETDEEYLVASLAKVAVHYCKTGDILEHDIFMPRLQGRPGILFFGLWVRPSVRPSIRPSVRLSVRPYVRPKRFKEVFQEGVVISL